MAFSREISHGGHIRIIHPVTSNVRSVILRKCVTYFYQRSDSDNNSLNHNPLGNALFHCSQDPHFGESFSIGHKDPHFHGDVCRQSFKGLELEKYKSLMCKMVLILYFNRFLLFNTIELKKLNLSSESYWRNDVQFSSSSIVKVLIC